MSKIAILDYYEEDNELVFYHELLDSKIATKDFLWENRMFNDASCLWTTKYNTISNSKKDRRS